jgi:hypothetical protein
MASTDSIKTIEKPRTVRLFMWDVSSSAADRLFAISNVVLIVGAAAVLIGTIGAIITSGIREQFSNERISANERATAEANARALSAELALAKFKAPRSLSANQLTAIRAAVAPFPNVAIDIWAAGEAPDLPSLISTLSTALEKAPVSWRPIRWTWTGIGAVIGAQILVKQGADDTIINAAKALGAVLEGTDLPADVAIWPGDWTKFGGMLNGPPFSADRAQIRLVIGSKPQ